MLGVTFDPPRRVMHISVLPRAKPEQHEMELVFARLVDEVIHYREVEGSSREFDPPNRPAPQRC